MIVPPTTEQLREMSAAPCPYWHNHANPPAAPASQERTGAVSWLCRIGLHRWKPVYRPGWFTFKETGVRIALSGPCWLDFGWMNAGRKCRRCGRRKA